MPVGRRLSGLAAFRALEPEVRVELTAGRTLVAIYEEKKGRLGISYSQFSRYARPLRTAIRAAMRAQWTGLGEHAGPREPAQPPVPAMPAPPGAPPKPPPIASAAGPPETRPKDVMPKLPSDDFAQRAKRDLF